MAQALKPRRARLRSPLALALAVIMGLLVVVEAASFLESRRVQRELSALVRTVERSTFLIGSVGQSLSRMRSHALEALTEPSGTAAPILEGIANLEVVLRERLVELPKVLATDELEVWSPTAREIDVVLREIGEAAREIGLGNASAAETRLDGVAAAMSRVIEGLQQSMDLNQGQTEAALAAADRLMMRARNTRLLLGGLLTAAIAAIAARTLIVLRRRELDVHGHVARIEETNRDLEAFAGRVAHDLRNVLAPLPISAELLAKGAGDAEFIAETAAGIGRVSQRAAEMISGLLAFARTGEPSRGGAASVELELGAVLEELAPLIRDTNARVRTEVAPDLCVAAENVLLHVVLLNLVSNAVKFLEGRPRREVVIRGEAAGGGVVIEVSDTGPGIAADALRHLFEPFYRAPGVRPSGEGIGLATVSRIVEAHHGQVDVCSAEGEGSTFRVTLPAAPAGASRRPAGSIRARQR